MALIRIFYSITTLDDISSVGFFLHDVAAAFFQNVKTNKHCTWYSVLAKQNATIIGYYDQTNDVKSNCESEP